MLQALWVDRLGLYIYSKVLRQTGGVVRVPFLRPVSDERDARSTLTMLGQTAWRRSASTSPSCSTCLSLLASAEHCLCGIASPACDPTQACWVSQGLQLREMEVSTRPSPYTI